MMRKLSALKTRLEQALNDLSLRKKLRYLFYFCILIPIFITDVVILHALIGADKEEEEHQMENIASSIQFNLSSAANDASVVATNLYMDDALQEFVSRHYESPGEYYTSYRDYFDNSLMEGISRSNNSVITIYADNETLVNGSGFSQLSSVADTQWYQIYSQGNGTPRLIFYYDPDQGRQVFFLRGMNRFYEDKAERFVRIKIDYSTMVRNFQNTAYNHPVYVCSGDRVVLTNAAFNNLREPFPIFDRQREVGFTQNVLLYGEEIQIHVLRQSNSILEMVRENLLALILLLLFNVIPPQIIMNLLEQSITTRLFRLSRVFNQVDGNTLIKISGSWGRDEIGGLMDNYNRMAERMNSLIDTVYRSRLKEQEMDIARQNAELLALYSQINPHFLFNALESIRMHSILKKEYETADMVEKLAVMERQNVDWSTDTNTIKKELEFAEAYLALQKYRFGERLNYTVEMQKECEQILVPKLTITTFVENACVHGIESKSSPGWIFVRVYIKNEQLCVEVEDTGGGISEDQVALLLERMRGASLEILKGKGRVGMVNTCLRIRMMTGDRAQFSVESELGIGTDILIQIPLEQTKKEGATC